MPPTDTIDAADGFAHFSACMRVAAVPAVWRLCGLVHGQAAQQRSEGGSGQVFTIGRQVAGADANKMASVH